MGQSGCLARTSSSSRRRGNPGTTPTVAVHVEQAERLATFKPTARAAARVLVEPAVDVEHVRIVAKRELRGRARAAGILPLGFGRQPIARAGWQQNPAVFGVLPITGFQFFLLGKPVAEHARHRSR